MAGEALAEYQRLEGLLLSAQKSVRCLSALKTPAACSQLQVKPEEEIGMPYTCTRTYARPQLTHSLTHAWTNVCTRVRYTCTFMFMFL